MKIRIITSCTNQKRYMPGNRLQREDFAALSRDEFERRERDLENYRLSAENMYTGQQHLPLMSGIRLARKYFGHDSIDLWIVSAGYGLIPGDREIVPYEATFEGMADAAIDEWSEFLHIPQKIRQILAERADLTILVVGESYLRALKLDSPTEYGAPTLIFTSIASQRLVKDTERTRVVPLSPDAPHIFSSALVGLKGQLVNRLLSQFVHRSEELIPELFDPSIDPLDALNHTYADPDIHFVINLPSSWLQKTHRNRLRFFIPEWDDRVDPDYDFETDTHSSGIADWTNAVYAHQLYSAPNYDGILVSRAVAETTRKKWNRILEMGIHEYLRVPNDFPIMGDCGAFSYLRAVHPPYTTPDILSYYTQFGFNFGVSIDHLIFGAETLEQRKERYQFTIDSAETFLREHQKLGLSWTPIGAAQGTSPKEYADAAAAYVKMGYKYIALGGLVRTKTNEIMSIASAVHEVVPDDIPIHLFGVARLEGLTTFANLGIRSVDSASYLRQAWMRVKQGYMTKHSSYSAIRIPYAEGLIRKLEKLGKCAPGGNEQIYRLEAEALLAVRELAQKKRSVDDALEAVLAYEMLGSSRDGMRELYQRTLSERPWEQCNCDICRKHGIEVVVFRGNNRNRRRGFHNTYVFYNLMQTMLDNPSQMADLIKPLSYQQSMPI